MKKILLLLVILCFSFLKGSTQTTITSTITIDQDWVNENGGPWTISDGVTVTFGENLTITNTTQYFEIIGSNVTINGAGYTVTINGVSNYPGLVNASAFNASTAEIKNIGVETSNPSDPLTLKLAAGYISSSGNRAKISYCYSNGLIYHYSGGIVGHGNLGDISNCYSTGVITGSVSGGIAGYSNAGKITNCYSTGAIMTSDGGGISGYNNLVEIINCYSTGIISGNSAGGIVGSYNSGIVRNSHSTGIISGDNAGGIAGLSNQINAIIVNCYSEGNISGRYAGGITSYYNNGKINNCYSIGQISGYKSGGIVGGGNAGDGEINNCYSTGIISGGSGSGGIVGDFNGGKIINCYTASNITNVGSSGLGAGITPSSSGGGTESNTVHNDSWNPINANTVLVGVGTIWNTSFIPYALTLITSPPTLTITAPLARLTSNCSAISSPSTTFEVNGLGLINDVVINAPTGFEISTISNTTYVSSLSLQRDLSLYTVSSTLYIRLSTYATNGASGTITASSIGASNAVTNVSSTIVSPPTLNASSFTLCAEASYPIKLTIDGNYPPLSNGWSTSSSTISVNIGGYITAGKVLGNYILRYTDACSQTASATVTVINPSASSVAAVTGGEASYKFDGTIKGPAANIFMGYNGYDYGSQTNPINPGFYKANKVDGSSAGCPYAFYIFSCTSCVN